MKIFYTASINGIDHDLDQTCPFRERTESGQLIYLGSVSCKECKHCYGYGQHPNDLHNLTVIPWYSRNEGSNKYKTDSELPEFTLKDCKFISGEDYVKCMLCYSEIGRKKKKNRFKLWYWKNIGEKLSNARYWIIRKYYDIKFNIKKY